MRPFEPKIDFAHPSIAGAVSCQVRRTRPPPPVRSPTTLTRIPPSSPAASEVKLRLATPIGSTPPSRPRRSPSGSQGDVRPQRQGGCGFPAKSRFEADDPRVQLGRNTDLIAKAPLKLPDPQPCLVRKMRHAEASAASLHAPCSPGHSAD